MSSRITTALRSARTTFQPRALAPSIRSLHATPLQHTTAGYGDPQDEKIDNHTPTPNKSGTPASAADPQPGGKGKSPKTKSGTTDPEVKPKKGKSGKGEAKDANEAEAQKKTGNAGGDGGSRSEKTPSATEIKETKKVGKEPKKEEVGGAGPIGG